MDLPGLAFLQEHRLQGRDILPTAMLLEAGSACADGISSTAQPNRCLAGVAFPAPLAPGSSHGLDMVLDAESGALSVGIRSIDGSTRVGLAAEVVQILTEISVGKALSRDQVTSKMRPAPNKTKSVLVGSPESSWKHTRGSACARLDNASAEQHQASWLNPGVGDATLQLAAALPSATDTPEPLRLPGGMEAYLGSGLRQTTLGTLWIGAVHAGARSVLHHWVLGEAGTSPAAPTMTMHGNMFASAEEWAARLRAAAAKAAAQDANHDAVDAESRSLLVATSQKKISRTTPGGQRSSPQHLADVQRKLLDIATELLGAEIAEDEPLMAAGLDSIGAVELRNAVATAFAVELPATVAFDYPTVSAMAGFVAAGSQVSEAESPAWIDDPSLDLPASLQVQDRAARAVISSAATREVNGQSCTSGWFVYIRGWVLFCFIVATRKEL